jgi:Co/Zn/Cd efflux system component
VVIEATYGILSGSMALVADAGHNLSDVLSLAIAWGASVLAARPPSAHSWVYRNTCLYREEGERKHCRTAPS